MITDKTFFKIKTFSEFSLFRENVQKIFNLKKYYSSISFKKICYLDIYTNQNFPTNHILINFNYDNEWLVNTHLIEYYFNYEDDNNIYNYNFYNDEETMNSLKEYKISKELGII